MSWFDAAGLANIAKTALKEAQKTIDKALDIRDDEDIEEDTKGNPAKECNQSKNTDEKQNALIKTLLDDDLKKDSLKASTMPTSTWGSFSGSFFEVDNSKKSSENSLLISTQPSLLTKCENDKETCSETVEANLMSVSTNLKSIKDNEYFESDKNSSVILETSEKSDKKNEDNGKNILTFSESQALQLKSAQSEILTNSLIDEKVFTRPKAKTNSSNRNSYPANRLSVLSSDSEGKKSSESVEVLSSFSCTTSPDSDLHSMSGSSSMGLPVSFSYTDSVEVIDSLTSPSSIEVLVGGSGSGRTTHSSLLNSPKDDIISNQNKELLTIFSSPVCNVNNVSPESFEIIPNLPEYDEELSVGDSYTSASESTGPTIVEPSHQYSYRTAESFPDVSQIPPKFHSGDSTPDIITKFSVVNRNEYDVLSESIHEKSLESNQCKSSEDTKNFIELEKQSLKSRGEFSECPGDVRKVQTTQFSPQLKLMLKSDDLKYQKSDFKNDLPKTHSCLKKEEEEGQEEEEEEEKKKKKKEEDKEDKQYSLSSPQGMDKCDSLGTEEISGSVSSFSDTKTIVANDSSCDDIVLESNSEDIENLPGSRKTSDFTAAERSGGDGVHNQSYYVKNLLSEAMREMTTRETSPTLSEKSRSDLIKLGSEQTSGHTSGDELETTTSSDIEIISRYSPNGDSSSTASRHSPAKLLHHNSKSKLSLVAVDILGKAIQIKNKGHNREPSDGSSFCSEDNFSEVEKLSKRVMELTEILEAKESRLNDLRKTNLEIQEKNQELKREVEQSKKTISSGLNTLQTESEKDELIRELKEEGEKLSKKELKQGNLIKTLRAHEKSQQTIIENNKVQIQNLTKTVEELKGELASKKVSEKNLTESVKQMNKKITRQDEEIASLLNQLEKAVVKAEELKFLLDAKEKELAKCKQILATEDFELKDAKALAESKEKQLERLKEFQESTEIKLEDLTQQLKKAEEVLSERERYNREEKNELMRRLQEAEERNEEVAHSVSKATRPLLRQMEALQATIAHERETWEKQERNLLQKLEDAENRLSASAYHEKSFKQEAITFRTKVDCLEDQLQAFTLEMSKLKDQVNFCNKQLDDNKKQMESERSEWKKQEECLKTQINSLKEEVAVLEQQLHNEKANAEAEAKRKSSLQEQMRERDAQLVNRDSCSPRSSPTLSFGRVSLSESFSSNVWPQFSEDGFETASVSGKCSNVYENLRVGNTATLIENLQAQLKMRDGEILQLQWESQRRDAERLTLTAELSALTSKLEEQENGLQKYQDTLKSLKELQTKYDALLEMYGEKVEEAEELRLDLQDVKEMYKSQIDQLLKKEKQDVLQ